MRAPGSAPPRLRGKTTQQGSAPSRKELEMSTPVGPRHNHSLKHKVPVGKVPVGRKNAQKEAKQPKEEKMTDIAPSAGRLFTFTIDANTAQVVKLEALDASGASHELSDEEKASLVQAGTEGSLEQFVEQAFEAGIACVLGSGEGADKAEEPAEEAELRHLLLAPLIEQSSAKRLMQREALARAILGTLIQHATKAPAAAGSSPTTELQPERAAPARAN
jgi:hypothetical protein